MSSIAELNRRLDFLEQENQALHRRISGVEQEKLLFMKNIYEVINDLQRQVDAVYYTKGAQLMVEQPERVGAIHRIVLEEMELDDNGDIFYKKAGPGNSAKLTEPQVFARYVMVYMLMKHLGYTYKKLEEEYGTSYTSLKAQIGVYLERPSDKEIIDGIDRLVTLELQAQRPYEQDGDEDLQFALYENDYQEGA